MHDAHIRLALRVGADAICEKPLVLNPWNLDMLQSLEEEYQKKIYTSTSTAGSSGPNRIKKETR
ncbi:MAG: hypothetical protein U5K00_22255 [Melioribacteraceae bacterium]|nr:hypothetical protein [Melioribacteraceae bacterium]